MIFISEPENILVDYKKFKQIILNKTRFATAMPVLVTLAGLPTSNKNDILLEVLKDHGVSRPACADSALGIAWHEFIACRNVEAEKVEYQSPSRDNCYVYAAYAALKHNSRLFRQVEHFLQADNALQVDLFKSPFLNKTFKKFYETLKQLIKKDRQSQTSPAFGSRFFDINLPNGFAYINMWDIKLSKTMFHFLPFLNGQLTNNYLWLFFGVHDIKESDLLAEIPDDHPDFEKLMLWKPRLYYLMRNVYLTSKMKKTKGKPQCTMILTSDETVTKEESQQCMKKVSEKMDEMKMEHLLDLESLCVPDSSGTCSQKLKKIGDSIITAGFDSKAQTLPFSWICLRNAFYENSMLYVRREEMKSIAEELLIDGTHFENFVEYFTSFGSIIDASKFGGDSPYIITNPVFFFFKLDELFYHTNDETFRKYSLITREGVERIFSKDDVDFFLRILLSVNLAVELQNEQLLLPANAFPADQQLSSANLSSDVQSVYYIPIASQGKCNTQCTHFALHLHITAGQVLCRNLQVKFTQIFLKEHSNSKMIFKKDECYANVTSITFNDSSFDVVCHGNEAEFIVNDEKNPNIELYEAIVDTLFIILKDLSASEPFFSFKFSFLCCKDCSVNKYELQQTCHFLPFTGNDCKECKKFMLNCHSLIIWNTILQQVIVR